MNEILTRFKEVKAKNEAVFMPFLVIGDPNPEMFLEIVKTIEPYSDYIELGIPFSDPIADGPVILTANERARKTGSRLTSSFSLIREVRKITTKPIVVLTYGNIIGVGEGRTKTLHKFAECGVNGIIAADIPIEEAHELRAETKAVGIDLIFLVSPLTEESRLHEIARNAQGFLYIVAVKGVTGVRSTILDETADTIKRITRSLGEDREVPVFVGFGISQPSHVSDIISMGADGVIIGSALIKRIEENLDDKQKMLSEIQDFVKSMKAKTKN